MASSLVTCEGLIDALRSKLAGMSDAELSDFKKYLQIPDNIYVAEAVWSQDKKKILLKRTDGVILEIGMCGYRAPQPCEYYATAMITACSKEVCGKPDRIAWAFHPDDLRDPEATVQLTNKSGETLAWLYPNEAPAHGIEVRDEKTKEVVGYAMASNIRRVWGKDCGCNDNVGG